MALAVRGILRERFYPVVQAKRFRGKINIQRPKPLHFDRAVFTELTKPWYLNPKRLKTPIELCSKPTDKIIEDVDNPYQRIIARELRERFDQSRLIAFYHRNSMNSDQQYKAYVAFIKAKMHIKTYGKKTLEMAVKDTKFEPVLDFYVSQNVMVFSPEPDIKQLLKVTKKFPQMVLLAAIFEGKFISKDEVMELHLIPNLQTAQAALVQTLNSATTTLTQQLNSHQNTLVSNLQERVKQLEEHK
ncbi:large ribosomal subunit protein uL10m [Zophobas morio]|uniref:large ribosomal subunit protein uL10m n=1 Tax=Zophobas morio TaxID=2755281 RepID=UPI003083954F